MNKCDYLNYLLRKNKKKNISWSYTQYSNKKKLPDVFSLFINDVKVYERYFYSYIEWRLFYINHDLIFYIKD